MDPHTLLDTLATRLGTSLGRLLDPAGCHLTFDAAPDLEVHWRPRQEVLCLAALVGHGVAAHRHDLHTAALLLNPLISTTQCLGVAVDAPTQRVFLRRSLPLAGQDDASLSACVAELLDRCAELRKAWAAQGLVAD